MWISYPGVQGPKGEWVDGVMLKNVEKAISEKKNRELLVLHMIGNQGPAY